MQFALVEATRVLVAASDGVATPTHNFHLTLAFLGAVPESRTREVGEIATRVASTFRAAPIAITLDHIDYWRKSEILCATSTAESVEAVALAETLHHELGQLSAAQFRPHVTLARKVRRRIPSTPMTSLAWTFKEFALVESQNLPTGSVYQVLASFPLS